MEVVLRVRRARRYAWVCIDRCSHGCHKIPVKVTSEKKVWWSVLITHLVINHLVIYHLVESKILEERGYHLVSGHACEGLC